MISVECLVNTCQKIEYDIVDWLEPRLNQVASFVLQNGGLGADLSEKRSRFGVLRTRLNVLGLVYSGSRFWFTPCLEGWLENGIDRMNHGLGFQQSVKCQLSIYLSSICPSIYLEPAGGRHNNVQQANASWRGSRDIFRDQGN